jgi:hypothetical protein
MSFFVFWKTCRNIAIVIVRQNFSVVVTKRVSASSPTGS